MRLFIQNEVLRSSAVEITDRESGSVIKIRYLDEAGEIKEFKFLLPVDSEFLRKKRHSSKLIRKLQIKREKDKCSFSKCDVQKELEMHALLYGRKDLYVHYSLLGNLKVIRTFKCDDDERGSIYFLKIKIRTDACVPIYISSKESQCLETCLLFHRTPGESANVLLKKEYNLRKNEKYISLDEIVS